MADLHVTQLRRVHVPPTGDATITQSPNGCRLSDTVSCTTCLDCRLVVQVQLLLTRVAEAPRRMTTMLWTIAVVLVVLWLLGLVSAYTMGGFIHILLVLAIIMVLVRVIQGRRPVG